jgi:hypothetical protein
MSFENLKVISTYTTKEAVSDCVLVRVKDAESKEAGIRFPVYLSQGVFSKYVQVPAGYEAEQDETGRLFDILNTFRYAAKRCSGSYFEFRFITHIPDVDNWEPNEIFTGGDRTYCLVKLKAIIQPQDFDDPSPAIFILKPSED